MKPDEFISKLKKKLVDEKGLKIKVKISPKSKNTKIISIMADVIKIALTEAPEKNKANQALISFLSKLFNIPSSNIKIISGHKSKNKVLLLSLNSPNS